MKKNDNEVWVGKNRLYLGKDNIIYVTGEGDVDEKIALKMKETVLNFSEIEECKGKKLNTLINVNKAGKQSLKARKIWKELTEHERAGKIAFCGMHPVARVIAYFVMGAANKEEMKFFKTEEEALAWLKE